MQNLVKKIALSIGIVIVFPMMVYYGVDTFSPAPKYADYQVKDYYDILQHGTEEQKKVAKTKQDKLDKERDAKYKEFERTMFFVSVPLGLAAIIIGAFLGAQAIGTGLMLGGIICISEGYIIYWENLESVYRFISLVLGFIVLLVVGFLKIEVKNK